jgi:hypothetical protein
MPEHVHAAAAAHQDVDGHRQGRSQAATRGGRGTVHGVFQSGAARPSSAVRPAAVPPRDSGSGVDCSSNVKSTCAPDALVDLCLRIRLSNCVLCFRCWHLNQVLQLYKPLLQLDGCLNGGDW